MFGEYAKTKGTPRNLNILFPGLSVSRGALRVMYCWHYIGDSVIHA